MNVKHSPQFFLGTTPSMAKAAINPNYPASGVMISRPLLYRKSDFEVGDWIFDSFAFTELYLYGCHTVSVEHRAALVRRWSLCGNLLAAVAQDYMCEPFILRRTGGTVSSHQALTIERYDSGGDNEAKEVAPSGF